MTAAMVKIIKKVAAIMVKTAAAVNLQLPPPVFIHADRQSSYSVGIGKELQMNRHAFNFNGGEYLSKIGATCFVSYSN